MADGDLGDGCQLLCAIAFTLHVIINAIIHFMINPPL